MVHVDVEQEIAAPPARVWELIQDHEGMPRWMPVREVVRRSPGSPDPNGVGAVRVLRGFGLVMVERVTVFEPPERLEYVLTEGAPIRDHRGEVTVSAAGAGTRVRWAVRFEPLIPGTGWLLRLALARGLRQGLAALRHLAEAKA
jgi:uncharacterized protein YndB with AHSA1/START domain